MTDIGVVSGVIELKDEFTSQLGLAQAALKQFTKEQQESLTAVGVVAGTVAGAFALAAVAATELGKRGADVNDVASTLLHFTGSAAAADAVLVNLRAGVLGTVTDFELMRVASHLLSAGVQLNAEDFSTLAQAAFVLQNRGLGGTKEMLDLVSDALVTGRTRALAMAVGVVDAGDAETNYAKSLGITKEFLSDTGKVEAKRLAVMQILNAAVKDAGKQERDFGEEIEFAKAKLTNFVDELSSAVAKSPVLAAGIKSVEEAIGSAFGGDSQHAVKSTTRAIEDLAVDVTYFVNLMVEGARVVHAVWETFAVVITTVETGVIGLAGAVASAMNTVAQGAASLPGATAGMKAFAAETQNAVDVTSAMRASLLKEAEAAADGVVGHSAFDKTLDALGGTAMQVRDRMLAAGSAEESSVKSADAAAGATNKLAAAGKSLASSFDVQKLLDQYDKSFKELESINASYASEVVKHSGTAAQAQKADIEAVFQKAVSSLDRLDPLFKEKYEKLRAIADEQLGAIGSDWDALRDKSIEGLQAQASAALADYEKMLTGGLHFSREVLDAQLKKYHDLQDAVRGVGDSTAASTAQMGTSAAAQVHVVESLAEAWTLVSRGIDASKVNVQLLDGEMVSLTEAQKRFEQGSSFTYDLSTREGIDQYRKMNPAANISWTDQQIIAYIKKGGTLQGLIQTGVINPYGAMGKTGFREGGMVDIKVGEQGEEVVRVPLGSTVFPSSTAPGGAGMTINNEFYVNGTGMDVYRQVKELMMRDLKHSRQFGAA